MDCRSFYKWAKGFAAVVAGTLSACGSSSEDSVMNASFLMADGQPLTTETAITSARPLDDGRSFRMGYGYDMMSGLRLQPCLDPMLYTLEGRNLSSTDTSFTLASTREEFARSMDLEFNAEASGSYGLFTGSGSSKTRIMRNAVVNSHSIYAVFRFSYFAQEIEIEHANEHNILTPEAAKLLSEDKAAFRLRCGDAYTRKVKTGADLFIVFNIESHNSEITSNVTTTNELKAAFAELFKGETTTKFTEQTKRVFSKFNVSADCHSVGISSNACAVPFSSVTPENLEGVVSFINEAKKSMADSTSSNPFVMVGVQETFVAYPKPENAIDKPWSETYFDYYDRLEILRDLLRKENEFRAHCPALTDPRCSMLSEQLKRQVNFCSRQDYWADCDPSSIDLGTIMALNPAELSPGSVTFYQHVGKGPRLVLDFGPTAVRRFDPDQVYDLKKLNFDTRITSFRSYLSPGWNLRLFEDAEGLGGCYLIKGSSNNRLVHIQSFNDHARSFRLERDGVYNNPCDYN